MNWLSDDTQEQIKDTMTTELFQNLIQTQQQTTQSFNVKSHLENVTENSAEKFSKVFDNAKSKYMSKDFTQTEIKTETSPNHTEKNIKNKNDFQKTDAQQENENTTEIELNHNKDINTDTDTETATQNNTEKKIETVETTPNNFDNNNKQSQEDSTDLFENIELKPVENTITKQSIYQSILNNIILGDSSNEDNTDEETNCNTTDTLLASVNQNFTENSNKTDVPDNSDIETESKIQTIDNNLSQTNIDIDQGTITTNTININTLNANQISEQNNLAKNTSSVNVTENIPTNQTNHLESDLPSQEEVNIETDTTDTLVIKVNDVIENSMDEFINEVTTNENTQNLSKVSQKIIDEMDVTIRSVESVEMQKMMQNNTHQNTSFNNSQNNAQENIIKMGIEDISTDTAPQPVFDIEQNLVNIDKPITTNPSISTSTKTISDAEILSQINSKITLPQGNTTSKVNIILQPENLGKVSVEIIKTQEGITAKMVAETTQIKDLLDKSLESLKNTLASQGVNVNNITVKVEESSAAQNPNFGFEQEQFNKEFANQSNQQQNTKDIHKDATLRNNDSELEESEIQDEPEDTQLNKINHNGSISITA